jgi:hypothetical protein
MSATCTHLHPPVAFGGDKWQVIASDQTATHPHLPRKGGGVVVVQVAVRWVVSIHLTFSQFPAPRRHFFMPAKIIQTLLLKLAATCTPPVTHHPSPITPPAPRPTARHQPPVTHQSIDRGSTNERQL